MYPWERDITREILNSTENPWINKEAIEDVCQGKFIKIVLVTAVFKNMEPIKTRLPITRVCVPSGTDSFSVLPPTWFQILSHHRGTNSSHYIHMNAAIFPPVNVNSV